MFCPASHGHHNHYQLPTLLPMFLYFLFRSKMHFLVEPDTISTDDLISARHPWKCLSPFVSCSPVSGFTPPHPLRRSLLPFHLFLYSSFAYLPSFSYGYLVHHHPHAQPPLAKNLIGISRDGVSCRVGFPAAEHLPWKSPTPNLQ